MNIDNEFKKIDKEFDKLANKNRVALEAAKIKPIHDKFPYAHNEIAAMIAQMGSGKTYNYLKLCAKQEHLSDDPFFELIAICS